MMERESEILQNVNLANVNEKGKMDSKYTGGELNMVIYKKMIMIRQGLRSAESVLPAYSRQLWLR